MKRDKVVEHKVKNDPYQVYLTAESELHFIEVEKK